MEQGTTSFEPYFRLPAALDTAGIDPYATRVYVHITRRGKGGCFSSLKTLAAICGMSVRKAQDALKTLEERGMIVKMKRPSRTDLYLITPTSEWKELDKESDLTDALDYFNRGVIRREQRDFAGALKDFEMSLRIYKQELGVAQQEGRVVIRKEKDIRDTEEEIKRTRYKLGNLPLSSNVEIHSNDVVMLE